MLMMMLMLGSFVICSRFGLHYGGRGGSHWVIIFSTFPGLQRSKHLCFSHNDKKCKKNMEREVLTYCVWGFLFYSLEYFTIIFNPIFTSQKKGCLPNLKEFIKKEEGHTQNTLRRYENIKMYLNFLKLKVAQEIMKQF